MRASHNMFLSIRPSNLRNRWLTVSQHIIQSDAAKGVLANGMKAIRVGLDLMRVTRQCNHTLLLGMKQCGTESQGCDGTHCGRERSKLTAEVTKLTTSQCTDNVIYEKTQSRCLKDNNCPITWFKQGEESLLNIFNCWTHIYYSLKVAFIN